MLGLLLVPGRGAVVRELDADVVCEPGPSGSSLVRCGGGFSERVARAGASDTTRSPPVGTCILTVFGVAPVGGRFGVVGPSVGLKTASASVGKLLPGIIFFSGGCSAGPGNGKPGGASRVESARRGVASARDSNPDALPELL